VKLAIASLLNWKSMLDNRYVRRPIISNGFSA
jgi:hypothetical protein